MKFHTHLSSYVLLKKLSKERQDILQNSLQLFDFYSECDDFNKWMREKSKVSREFLHPIF